MRIKTMKNILILSAIILLTIGCSKINSVKEPGKEIVLRLEPNEDNPRNSEGDFIQLKDGSILFIYTYFTTGSGDNAKAHLKGRYSYDQGKTWSDKDVTILKNEGGMNIMSVSLLRLQSGEIALFYIRKNSETDCIPYMRISTDEAKTWGDAVRVIPTTKYHVVNNDRLVQLPSGRLIFPTSIHEAPQWATGKILCYYSDDNGKTWSKSENVSNPENVVLQEPGIVELKDGKLMMFIRTDAGVQYLSFSEDQGVSWSAVEPSTIKSPLSPASIERIPSTGDLMVVWNNNYKEGKDAGKRTPFNLAISKDEGVSWSKIKTLESDPSGWYCYTAINFVGNNVLLGHCAGNRKVNNGLAATQITRLNLDWIYQDAIPAPYISSEKKGVVTLSCKDKDAEIRYTLDGSLPTEESGILYKDEIVVTNLTLLNMQTYKLGEIPSQIISTQIGSQVFQSSLQIDKKLEEGLAYNYYEGEFRQTIEITDRQKVKSGVAAEISIDDTPISENFAYLFEGYIKIPKDGLYTFNLESNDGSVMYLNDYKIIDNDGYHGAYLKSASTSLNAGLHKLTIKYFQFGGGKTLNVSWEGKDFSRQEIPADLLYH